MFVCFLGDLIQKRLVDILVNMATDEGNSVSFDLNFWSLYFSLYLWKNFIDFVKVESSSELIN